MAVPYCAGASCDAGNDVNGVTMEVAHISPCKLGVCLSWRVPIVACESSAHLSTKRESLHKAQQPQQHWCHDPGLRICWESANQDGGHRHAQDAQQQSRPPPICVTQVAKEHCADWSCQVSACPDAPVPQLLGYWIGRGKEQRRQRLGQLHIYNKVVPVRV
jgi:hypothetical protein